MYFNFILVFSRLYSQSTFFHYSFFFFFEKGGCSEIPEEQNEPPKLKFQGYQFSRRFFAWERNTNNPYRTKAMSIPMQLIHQHAIVNQSDWLVTNLDEYVNQLHINFAFHCRYTHTICIFTFCILCKLTATYLIFQWCGWNFVWEKVLVFLSLPAIIFYICEMQKQENANRGQISQYAITMFCFDFLKFNLNHIL